MVGGKRWRVAQTYERGYWEEQASQIAAGAISQLDWYRWRSDQLVARLARIGIARLADGTARVIEVGGGPVGVATYFPSAHAMLVDPLDDFYASNASLAALRRPDAQYVTGRGEALPAADGDYDLAIIENCIDHVQDTDGVLRELVRVLRPDGMLYLTVNCRSATGYYVHRMISRLRLDPGHPHTFTPERLRSLLEQYGFEILDMECGSYEAAHAEDLASTSSRSRLKARLGVSEYLASVIAKRLPAGRTGGS